MYHCHLHICLIGADPDVWEPVRRAAPLRAFTHSFAAFARPEEAQLAGAGLILADLRGLDERAAAGLLARQKPPEAELILLALPEQAEALYQSAGGPGGPRGETGEPCEPAPTADPAAAANDIWLLPLSAAGLRYRFARWQAACKAKRDAWESAQFLEATIQLSPNLIWYKTRDGVHEKVNGSFCRTVGKTRQQVEGQRHAYIWDVEEDDPACIESERQVMEHRQTYVAEEEVRTGGDTRLLTTYKAPLYDLDGSVMGTVGTGLDITKERAFEQELLRRNQTLETIFTTLDCGVLCHTLEGDEILSVNQAALDILGYQSTEAMLAAGFHLVADSVVEEDKPVLRRAIRTLHEVNDSVSVEYRVRHTDGRLLHVTGNIKLLEEEGRRFYRRFLLDCTAQKQQETREREQNRRYHMELIQALSMDYSLVCLFDLDSGKGTLLRMRECEHGVLVPMFSGEPMLEKSMGRYIDTCVLAEDRAMMRDAVSPARLLRELEEDGVFYCNYRTLCGGQVRYFQMKAVRTGRWSTAHTAVLGLRCVDEETQREMEKTTMLENALAQANRANQAKSTFLSNMSHDIRTPMNAIIGFTNLAINHLGRTDLVEEYLHKIMASGSHLLSLINDVLDMSHIESGKIHLDEQPCSLPELLHSLYSIVQVDAQAKQLQLQFEAGEVENEGILCDRLRLNQILLNLLSNAVKYTNPGGRIRLRLAQRPGPQPGVGWYEFWVEDTGIGMSEAFIGHIFEPFERERNSTISGIQGTGLGMAITRNLVEMMQGEIAIQSRQGEGTRVRVAFPFRQTEGAVAPANAAPAEKSGPRRSGRILLTEDNELNQEIAVAILEDEGFTVEVAGNGREAVEMLCRRGAGWFRLVLMDIQMPVMNGYEAAEAIRALPDAGLAHIPIIAMTANAFEEDKQEALRHGMNAHIAKPIDVGLLLAALDKAGSGG